MAWYRSPAGCGSSRSAPPPSRNGTLAKGQVEVIVAKLDDATIDAFAEAESELVPYLAPLTLAGCARAMAAWKEQVEEAKDSAEPERSLHLSATLDGRHVIEGHLDAEGGAVVATALRLATVDDPGLSPAQRRAEALVAVSRFFLDHQQSIPAGRHRPHLNVVVDLDALQEGRGGRVIGGPGLDGPTLSTMLCDSGAAPGPDQGPLGHPRLRHVDEDHPRHPVERTGHPGRGMPLPGL